jgi:PAS domain S-box-containing protein
VLVETDGIVRYANHAAARLLALSREDLVGVNREDFTVTAAREDSDGIPGEEHWRASDGRGIPVEVASSAIRWDGRPARQLLARDISARKKLEQELRAVSKQKDEFLGLVSHELRTPLTVIRGVADMLKREDGRLLEMAETEATALLWESAERLGAVVDNMLSLAQLTHESISLEPVLVRIVVLEAIARHRRRFPNRRIEVQVESAIMHANAASVDQILENLLSNAEKYSADTTTIEVVTKTVGNEIQVLVLDEGEGLDANEVDSYFASFFRSQRREADQKPGAGLGLTVCKLLVEAQGGRIWARSRPTGGAEFGFAVPSIQIDAD